MRRRLLGLFVLALLGWVIITLPASLFFNSSTEGLAFDQVEGTVWSGRAQWVLPAQAAVPVQWRWQGGGVWRWSVESSELSLEGLWRLWDRQRLESIQGWVDVSYLDAAQWLVVIWPVGTLNVDIETLSFEPKVRFEASGRVTWENAALRGLVNERLGEVTIDLEAQPEQGETQIRLASVDSPVVKLGGDLTTNGDRYRADLWLEPQAGHERILRYLAPLGELSGGRLTIKRSGQWGIFE